MKERPTIVVDRVEVVFKVPTTVDALRAWEALPVLPSGDGGADVLGPPKPQSAISQQLRMIEAADRFLCFCALKPRLVLECPEALPEDTISVQELDPKERSRAADVLLELAGYTKEAVEEARPFADVAAGTGP